MKAMSLARSRIFPQTVSRVAIRHAAWQAGTATSGKKTLSPTIKSNGYGFKKPVGSSSKVSSAATASPLTTSSSSSTPRPSPTSSSPSNSTPKESTSKQIDEPVVGPEEIQQSARPSSLPVTQQPWTVVNSADVLSYDSPPIKEIEPSPGNGQTVDWSQSYHGLGTASFSPEIISILSAPLDPEDIEIKPDGLIFLPEIKYRRILNKAFGPGGWGLAPRSDTTITPRTVTREYALICLGRLIAVARGEQDYFDPSGIPTATEGCKSNGMLRCCKDLGIASELWDPRFIREFKKNYCHELFVEHVVTKKKKKIWKRKDADVPPPYK